MKTYLLLDATRNVKKMGKSSTICDFLNVSRQALSRAVNNGTKCKGYFVEAYPTPRKQKPKSKRHLCSKGIELLKQSREIIDDYNIKLIESGEYCHVNIIRRIDDLLKALENK